MSKNTRELQLKHQLWVWRVATILMGCMCCVLIVSNNRIHREKENDEQRYLEILEMRDRGDKQIEKLTATANKIFEHRRVQSYRDLESANADFKAQIPKILAQRLLKYQEDRKTWPSNGVKILLKNPMVSVLLSLPNQKPVEVHAWSNNSNDFSTAMMRLDEGDLLYQITDEEFRLLKQLQTQNLSSQDAPTP